MFSLKNKTIALSLALSFVPVIAQENNKKEEENKKETIFTTQNIIIASVVTSAVAGGAYAAYIYQDEIAQSFNDASEYVQSNVVAPTQTKFSELSEATQKSFADASSAAQEKWNELSEKITKLFAEATESTPEISEEAACPGMALEDVAKAVAESTEDTTIEAPEVEAVITETIEARPVNLGRDLGEALKKKQLK